MILILICAGIFAFGVAYMLSTQYGKFELLAMISCISGGLGLFMCVVTIPLERMGWQSEFLEIEAIRESRATEDPIEGAAWRMKVAEVNARIAKGRYYNGTLFDIWIPDEIEKVEPIK